MKASAPRTFRPSGHPSSHSVDVPVEVFLAAGVDVLVDVLVYVQVATLVDVQENVLQ